MAHLCQMCFCFGDASQASSKAGISYLLLDIFTPHLSAGHCMSQTFTVPLIFARIGLSSAAQLQKEDASEFPQLVPVGHTQHPPHCHQLWDPNPKFILLKSRFGDLPLLPFLYALSLVIAAAGFQRQPSSGCGVIFSCGNTCNGEEGVGSPCLL